MNIAKYISLNEFAGPFFGFKDGKVEIDFRHIGIGIVIVEGDERIDWAKIKPEARVRVGIRKSGKAYLV